MGKGSQRGSGTVKRQNKKVPHMTLRIGGTKDEMKATYLKYFGSNRKGKRDMLRRQKLEARFARFKFRTTVPFGSGKSEAEKRNYVMVYGVKILKSRYTTPSQKTYVNSYVKSFGESPFANLN